MAPIPKFISVIEQNHTGSKPSLFIIGIIIGMVIMVIDIRSMKHPSKRIISCTRITIMMGGAEKVVATLTRALVLPVFARTYLKNRSRHLLENITYTGDGPNK